MTGGIEEWRNALEKWILNEFSWNFEMLYFKYFSYDCFNFMVFYNNFNKGQLTLWKKGPKIDMNATIVIFSNWQVTMVKSLLKRRVDNHVVPANDNFRFSVWTDGFSCGPAAFLSSWSMWPAAYFSLPWTLETSLISSIGSMVAPRTGRLGPSVLREF